MRSRLALAGLAVAITVPAAAGVAHAGRSATPAAVATHHRLFAVVKADGTLVRSFPAAGVTSTRAGNGRYTVTFPQNVSTCAWVATIGEGALVTPVAGQIAVFGNGMNVLVDSSDSRGLLSDRAFHLVVICPS